MTPQNTEAILKELAEMDREADLLAEIGIITEHFEEWELRSDD
jgi:hypothetical protein